MSWSCAICTYENVAQHLACAICNKEKPVRLHQVVHQDQNEVIIISDSEESEEEGKGDQKTESTTTIPTTTIPTTILGKTDPSSPSPYHMQLEGLAKTNTLILVLVGLPGSGKSSFCDSLLQIMMNDAPNTTNTLPCCHVVCQDVLGTRLKCEKVVRTCLQNEQHVIVDRTNITIEQRKKC